MVKPPRIRHSKPKRDPVTIDLDPGEVKRSPSPDDSASARPERPASTPAASAASSAGAKADASSTGTSGGATKSSALATDTPKADAAKTDTSESRSGRGADEKGSAPSRAETAGSETPRPESIRSEPSKVDPSAPKASPASAFGRDAARPAPAGSARPEPVSAPRPQSSAPSAARNDPPRKRSGVSLVAAGLIGGVVAIAGAGALQFAGLLPSPGAGRVDLSDLEAEIATLRAEVAARPGDDGTADAVAAANTRLGDLDGALDALRAEVETVKNTIASGGAGDEAALQGFQTRLADLEEQVSSLRETAPDAGETEALSGRVDSVETVARTASEAAAAAASAATAASEKIAAIETEIAGMNERLAEQAQNPRIALAIAAAGLKSAIDRGAPFMTELETYAAIAPDAPEIAALREMAAAGVPTRAQIAERAPDAVTRMIDAAEPVDPNAGFFSRLAASFQSVVKVRPVGEVEGEGVGPTAARIEAAVQANDYARALAEYETLPDIAKAAGAGFIADLRARQTADELVENALSGALRA